MRRRARPALLRVPCRLSPDEDNTPPLPSAVSTMDGFDDLPPDFRALLNYHAVDMVSDDRPFRAVAQLIASHGHAKVYANLIETLDEALRDPTRFRDTHEQNTTHRAKPRQYR